MPESAPVKLIENALISIDALASEIAERYSDERKFSTWSEAAEEIMRPNLRFTIQKDVVQYKASLDPSQSRYLQICDRLDQALKTAARFPSVEVLDRAIWRKRILLARVLYVTIITLMIAIFGEQQLLLLCGSLVAISAGESLRFKDRLLGPKRRFFDVIPAIRDHVRKALTDGFRE